MKIRFVAFYNKDGRVFRPHEEYTVDGVRYQHTTPCNCAGAGFKTNR